jgi:putative tryptophan/tyrosine transport system substrate-binding protein
MREDSTMRLILILTLTLGIVVASLAAEAQQPTHVYRIGRLSNGPLVPQSYPILEAFRQGLRDLGYVEGQNLVIEYRYAEGNAERLVALAAELARLKLEVIVAGDAAATRAAQHATRTIPIVIAGSTDPVGQGLVASLAQPGGNTTGLSYLSAELPGKQLEFLKETLPQCTRIAVLGNPASSTYGSRLNNLTVAARALGIQLHVVELHSLDELDAAFAAMTRAGTDALMVAPDPVLITILRGSVVADLATKNRLPAMYAWREYVDAGGLMSYGPNLPDLHRRAAVYVDKILKGANPAELPVEQATKFELVINLKTAKAMGLTIPPSILFQADEVIR